MISSTTSQLGEMAEELEATQAVLRTTSRDLADKVRELEDRTRETEVWHVLCVLVWVSSGGGLEGCEGGRSRDPMRRRIW